MSLALAAKHLESQGRNQDSKLVHMTPDELRALNKMSLDHVGKPLSTNPKTGLPEAGFLSSILPTVVGAGLSMIPGVGPLMAAGIVGLGSYALTGDIGQGIMAGLGAWSGGKLASDIAGASTLAQSGADVGAKAFEATADSALKTTMEPFSETLGRTFTTDPTKSFIGQSFTPTTATTIADQAKNFIPQTATAATAFPQGAAAYTPFQHFQSGLDYATAHPIDFLSKPGVGLHAASVAIPPLLSVMEPEYTLPTTTVKKNPFGLKSITSDFTGTFPAQPNPYVTAQYPNYRTNPYFLKDGGLSSVNNYASGKKVDYTKAAKSGEDIMAGVKMATVRPLVDLPIPDVGIYADDKKYANMDPYERALAMLKDIKGASGISSRGLPNLKQVSPLGAISVEPTLLEDQLSNQARQQIAQEAKSGGLMDGHLGDYSDGGRLLKGPGDGVSDSIPATIGGKQAARLAEGEFVIPARIVSELGNGSTDAGAKRLYAMMDRIKAKRRKAKDIAADTKAYKLLPA